MSKQSPAEQLYSAIKAGEPTEVERLFKRTPGLEQAYFAKYGETPFHILILPPFWSELIAEKLVENNCPMDRADTVGETPLMCSVLKGHLISFDCFLRHKQVAGLKVGIDAQDKDGMTALHIAAGLPHRQTMIERLLSAGANPLLRNVMGLTPLMIADISGYSEMAEALAYGEILWQIGSIQLDSAAAFAFANPNLATEICRHVDHLCSSQIPMVAVAAWHGSGRDAEVLIKVIRNFPQHIGDITQYAVISINKLKTEGEENLMAKCQAIVAAIAAAFPKYPGEIIRSLVNITTNRETLTLIETVIKALPEEAAESLSKAIFYLSKEHAWLGLSLQRNIALAMPDRFELTNSLQR